MRCFRRALSTDKSGRWRGPASASTATAPSGPQISELTSSASICLPGSTASSDTPRPRGHRVEVGWRHPPGSLGGDSRLQDVFDRDIARWEKEYPELTILRQVCFGQPRTTLLDAASGAQLLIVGGRGRGGLKGMLLGSVSQAMLNHARCPVGVVQSQ